MIVAVDLDGTIDSFPRVFQSLMSDLVRGANQVFVLTGASSRKVTPQDKAAKRGYLTSLGIGPSDYTDVVVVAKPVAKNKAKWIDANKADLLIDNNTKTAKRVKSACPVLALWNSKTK